jgi:hypothetical protein
MSLLGRCPFPDCDEPEIPDTYPRTLLRRELSSGWVVLSRKGGGVHAVEMAEYTGRLAHARCIERAKRGLIGQRSLL